MLRRGRRCNNHAETDMILGLMFLAFALPIGATYWAFKGDTETKRIVGTVGLIIMVVLGFFSMITG